jgi:hypothetical protein
MSAPTAFYPLPTVPPLPRTPAEPTFTGQTTPASIASAPHKAAQPALLPNVTPTTEANVTHSVTANVTPTEPADPLLTACAPLREYLDRYGSLTIDPRDPPWADPRPDLVADHSRWWLVLEAAYRLDGQDPDGVYGGFSGLRCCGARLEIAGPANWSLTAEGSPPTWKLTRGEEMTEAEYQGYRQTYLVPHTAAIRKLLNAPEAGQLAQQRPATPTPDKFTGQAPATATAPAPRKNGASAQPALRAVAPVPAPVTMVGGDW